MAAKGNENYGVNASAVLLALLLLSRTLTSSTVPYVRILHTIK